MKRGHARPRGTPPRIAYDEVPCAVPGLDGPCHVFKGAKIGLGYGKVGIGSKTVLVHRYVWERDVGPIPPGLQIDHICRNKACCNVRHLRVVTHKVNTTENSNSVGARNKVKTHCPAGHEFTPDNTRINRVGARVCRACHYQHNVTSRARKRESRL